MTLTIELTPEMESRLEAEAKRKGLETEEFAKIIIEQNLSPKEENRKNYMPEGFKPRYLGRVETRDFSGDDQWLRENRENYQGKYVATHGNRLIANGENLKEVIEKSRELGLPDSLLTYVEPLDTPPYVGGVW
ncbi:MAG: hypothetical protein HC846_04700 [Blastocatellia bacterium]|nr:hypothetical protein [Blastocatellia bacterium]